MTDKRYRFLCVAVLATAFIIRLGVAVYWNSFVLKTTASAHTENTNGDVPLLNSSTQDGPFFFGDSDSYWKLGRAVAFGRPYEFDQERHWQIFRTPGYPILLAPLFWLFGDAPPVFAARLQGACFGTLNVALVFLLASVYFEGYRNRRWIAFFAALFVSLDPTLALQSVCVLSEESFLTFASALNVAVITTARRLDLLPNTHADCTCSDIENADVSRRQNSNQYSQAFLLALFATGAIYIRPSWLYYLPFAFVCIVVFRVMKSRSKDRLKTSTGLVGTPKTIYSVAIVLVVTFAFQVLFLSPWIYRNLKLTGRIIPTSLQMGASLYDGLNPNATGASDMSFVDKFRYEELVNPSDSPDVHFEVRLDERLKREAVNWAKSHPGRVAKLACVKLYRLWAPIPREKAFSRPSLKIALLITYAPIFILGLCGAFRSWRRKGAAWSLAIPTLYLSAIHMVFVSSIRYRTPALPGLAILAAYWVITSYEEQKNIGINSNNHNNNK